MAEELKGLRIARGNIKRNITVLRSYIDDTKFENAPDECAKLNLKLGKLPHWEAELYNINDKMALICTDEEMDIEHKTSSALIDQLDEIRIMTNIYRKPSDATQTTTQPDPLATTEPLSGIVQKLVEQLQVERQHSARQHQTVIDHMVRFNRTVTESSQNTAAPSRENSDDIKLHRLDIPKFSGKYSDWPSFHAMFVSTVHENAKVKDVRKMQYLRNALTGEAESVIKHLNFTDANYAVAWKLLNDRYDKKKHIITAHVKAFYEQHSVPFANAPALRKLFSTTSEIISSLHAMGAEYEARDLWLIYVLIDKLDTESRTLWSREINEIDLPTLELFLKFLDRRCDELETQSTKRQPSKPNSSSSATASTSNKPKISAALTEKERKCLCCDAEFHPLFKCSKFQGMPIDDRRSFVKNGGYCFNCLCKHFGTCSSTTNCKHCQKRHHSLVHIHRNSKPNDEQKSSSSDTTTPNQSCGMAVCEVGTNTNEQVFLATVLINIIDEKGRKRECRALLDSGSQVNIIRRAYIDNLCVRKIPVKTSVCGIAEHSSEIAAAVRLTIASIHSEYYTNINLLVMNTVTNDLPATGVDITDWIIPSDMKLADSTFNIPSKIDVLLGAEVVSEVMLNRSIKFHRDLPTFQNTKFGWIVYGLCRVSKCNSRYALCVSNDRNSVDELNEQMSKFWQIENCDINAICLSKEELFFEEHFDKTTTRSADGKFIVRLPFREGACDLGDSRQFARRRYLQLERRLEKDGEMQQHVLKFMRDYIEMGHMSRIEDQCRDGVEYFIPYHPIVKPSSTTTKVRVVFDASAKSSSGKSLNDKLSVGPTVQESLWNIVLRFRMHNIVITGDIKMHFRQIWMHPDDRKFLKIFWRESSSEPLAVYQLNTNTYGTASAAHQAKKCVEKIALLSQHTHPIASKVALRDFYMDDVLSGAPTVAEATHLREELSEMLSQAGFPLYKFTSNSEEVLSSIPAEERALQTLIEFDECFKSLGLFWQPLDDMLRYMMPFNQEQFSKRSVLAETAKLFDPLGLISPIVVKAKIFMQELWKLKIDWDQSLSGEFQERWLDFYHHLNAIQHLRIPRRVINVQQPMTVNLIGFADASEQAYGACVYVQAIDRDGTFSSTLLCAKSRVAPTKLMTIPRLELCAAHLLADLIQLVTSASIIQFNDIFAFTDSTITLHWIKSEPHRWKIFVANRVTKIQAIVPQSNWYHVNTQHNPADVISRGLHPTQIADNKLWWHGPGWLCNQEFHNHVQRDYDDPDDDSIRTELKQQQSIIGVVYFGPKDYDAIEQILTDCSRLIKLRNVTAYCLRFLRPHHQDIGPISSAEGEDAMLVHLKYAQAQSFQEHLTILKAGKLLPNNDKFRSLSIFLDSTGLIRVGGRLRNAQIDYDTKHPILLPAAARITTLILEHEHRRLLHCGPEALLASVRQRYWPINGRSACRQLVRNCVLCLKANPTEAQQQMGQLPKHRIEAAFPFVNCGIDYAGPFTTVHGGRGRTRKFIKSYVALFICFNSKAIHLEAVSDLTTAAFTAALRRFIARRGLPSNIYSDNGSNFKGAFNELSELYAFIQNPSTNSQIHASMSEQNVNWHFIPPYTPHQGGLWESHVKIVKRNLLHAMGNQQFTFEEFSTALTVIEACVNSRPICYVSNDPNDLSTLTPGHFIIGRPLCCLPEHDLTAVPHNRLTNWQLISAIRQDFWNRWKVEYVTSLQPKSKWHREHQNVIPGDVVILKDVEKPPLQWSIGVIHETFPGDDGLVRTVSVKTTDGIYRRGINNIAKLPLHEE